MSAVRGHHQRPGRDHWNQQVDPEEIGDRQGEASLQPDGGGTLTGTSKSIQRKLVSNEEKRHSSQKVEGRTELDLVQDEVDEAKRLLEEAHVEIQAAQNKETEAAFRVGQAMAQIRKLLGVNLKPTDQ